MYTGVQMRTIVKVDAALGMRSVAPHIEHQVASHLRCENWPLLTFQQRECHIDTRSCPSTGCNAAIMHKQHSVKDLGSWISLLQVRHYAPMRGTVPSIEQASFPKQKGSR